MRSIDHVWLEQLQIRNVAVAGLEFTHVLDILVLVCNERAIWVSFTMNKSQHPVAVFPSVLACEPTWGLWKEDHGEEQADGRNHLKTPGDSEGRWAIGVGVITSDERATIRNATAGKPDARCTTSEKSY